MIWRIGTFVAILVFVSGCDVRSPDFTRKLLTIEVCAKPASQPCPSLQCTTANATVPVGFSQNFCAVGRFSGVAGERGVLGPISRDITSRVEWSTGNPALATVTADGLARGVGVTNGVSISAALNGRTGSTSLRVLAPTLQRVQVDPPADIIVAETLQRFRCTGVFSDDSTLDISRDADWGTSAPAVMTIEDGANGGLATALAAGQTEISCTTTVNGVVHSDSVTVTVIDADLTNLAVLPAGPITIAPGASQDYRAIGTYSSTNPVCNPQCLIDVTLSASWASGNSAVAEVGNTPLIDRGTAIALSPGTAEIFANLGGLQGSTILNVFDANILEVRIEGPDIAFPGFPAAYTAVAVTQDPATGELVDQEVTVSSSTIWSTSNPALATVPNNDGVLQPEVSATASSVAVLATYRGVTGSKLVSIVEAELTQIIASPNVVCVANDLVPAGVSLRFRQINAFGVFELPDETVCATEITEAATWASQTGSDILSLFDLLLQDCQPLLPIGVGEPPVLVSNAPGTKGLALANPDAEIPDGALGSACITATVPGFDDIEGNVTGLALVDIVPEFCEGAVVLTDEDIVLGDGTLVDPCFADEDEEAEAK